MSPSQSLWDIRCEWGNPGLEALLPGSDVVIIVDVLSFCTCLDIAVGRGAIVFPFPFRDAGTGAMAFASIHDAVLAGPRKGSSDQSYSLSPQSLLDIPAATRLVLPSPNGGTLAVRTGTTPTLAGCLRNAHAVARVATGFGKRISVIPAGERWPDGTVRFAIEDWIAAGAIIRHLPGRRSPEAALAEQSFLASPGDIRSYLINSVSGRELVDRGFEGDVGLATIFEESDCVPILKQEAFVDIRDRTFNG